MAKKPAFGALLVALNLPSYVGLFPWMARAEGVTLPPVSLHGGKKLGLPTPFRDIARGFKTYMRGVTWLREHPRYFGLLFIPVVVGLMLAVAGLAGFMAYDEDILNRIMFAKPDAWYGMPFYYLGYGILWVSILALVLLGSLLSINVIASPFYEIVSTAIERDLTGKGGADLTLLENLKVMFVELKKVLLILVISLVLLFVPIINVISTLIAAFLIGWDFFDFPAARHGWSLGDRINFVLKEFWSVLGLGLWLVIPFVQIFMMPLAVAGGTILSLEAMEKRGQVVLKRHLRHNRETLNAADYRS